MENVVDVFQQKFSKSVDEVKYYCYDCTKNNITIYIFNNDELYNIYILPKNINFKIDNEEIFSTQYLNQFYLIENISLSELKIIFKILRSKYNVKFYDITRDIDNYNLYISNIRNSGDLFLNTDLFLRYDKSNTNIKIKKYR